MRTLWQVLAIGWGIYLTMVCVPFARAENATDKAIRAVLDRKVNIDHEHQHFSKHLQNLSKAIDVPIEIDKSQLGLEGITFGSGPSIQTGERTAKELLKLILLEQGRDRFSFIVLPAAEKRSNLAFRIVIVRHALIEERDWIVPPSDSEEAARIVAERLSKRINIDVESDAPAGHWQRLSQLIEIPIDVDKEVQSLFRGESSKLFKLSVGERTAQEILDWTIVLATNKTSLTYMIANDPQRRFAHEIRIVIATRKTITMNPARFSWPRHRPPAQSAKP